MLVATSNQPPDQLYAEGYNRERFLLAIAALQAHMQVVAVDATAGSSTCIPAPKCTAIGYSSRRPWPSCSPA